MKMGVCKHAHASASVHGGMGGGGECACGACSLGNRSASTNSY